MSGQPWYVAALASWGIALFEYLLQVPANRIGYTALSLGQLKILQEVVTLAIFIPFAFLSYATASQAGLFVGGIVPARSGVFYFSCVSFAELLDVRV